MEKVLHFLKAPMQKPFKVFGILPGTLTRFRVSTVTYYQLWTAGWVLKNLFEISFNRVYEMNIKRHCSLQYNASKKHQFHGRWWQQLFKAFIKYLNLNSHLSIKYKTKDNSLTKQQASQLRKKQNTQKRLACSDRRNLLPIFTEKYQSKS